MSRSTCILSSLLFNHLKQKTKRDYKEEKKETRTNKIKIKVIGLTIESHKTKNKRTHDSIH